MKLFNRSQFVIPKLVIIAILFLDSPLELYSQTTSAFNVVFDLSNSNCLIPSRADSKNKFSDKKDEAKRNLGNNAVAFPIGPQAESSLNVQNEKFESIKIHQSRSFSLSQNYPNPFNPSTTISFTTFKPGIIRLVLYDLLGRTIRIVANENLQPGNYEIKVDGNGLASGEYVYSLETNDYREIKKMMLVK